MPPSPNRRTLLLAVAVVALAAPAAASAHGRSRVVALDFRLRLERVPAGIRAEVLGGNRWLQLRVDSGRRVIVLGALGEPMLRFDGQGVSANQGSPTASADRIVRAGRGWRLLTHGHYFRWHDHRLAPLPGPHPRLTVPLIVDGRSEELTGTFTRVARPRLWPWLIGAAALVAALARIRSAAVAALAGAVGAVVAAASISAWLEAGIAVVLVLAAARALLWKRGREGIAGVVGAVAFAISLGSISVFWHGAVVSTFPPWLVRLATAVAFVGGVSAVLLGVLASEPWTEEVPPVRRDVGTEL